MMMDLDELVGRPVWYIVTRLMGGWGGFDVSGREQWSERQLTLQSSLLPRPPSLPLSFPPTGELVVVGTVGIMRCSR